MRPNFARQIRDDQYTVPEEEDLAEDFYSNKSKRAEKRQAKFLKRKQHEDLEDYD